MNTIFTQQNLNTLLIILGGISAVIIVFTTHKTKLTEANKSQSDSVIQLLSTEKDAWKESAARLEKERAASDVRHEAVIAEYRGVAGNLRVKGDECVAREAAAKVELAELRGRTDFKPVMEFQKTWHQEWQSTHNQIIENQRMMAPILIRVADVLEKFGASAHDVIVKNPANDPANVQQVGKS